jgi:hypothetical protein
MYRVSATIRGKRIITTFTFKTKAEANKYAKETNAHRSGVNARPIKDTLKSRQIASSNGFY